jgi:hypothetical protein
MVFQIRGSKMLTVKITGSELFQTTFMIYILLYIY